MNRHTLLGLLALVAVMTFTACEHIDLEDVETTSVKPSTTPNTDTKPKIPTQTGQGTIDAPYTIAQFNAAYADIAEQQVWVIGYCVGSTYKNMGNATFEPPFQYETNILISDQQQVEITQFQENADICIPIELKSAVQKRELSLVQNPDMLHQCVLIHATARTYFKHNALRDLTDYYWFPGQTIPTPLDEDWVYE